MWVTSSLETALIPTAVALGNFDGVHRGHEQVVQKILEQQQVDKAALGQSWRSPLQVASDFPDQSTLPPPFNSLSEAANNYTTVVTFNPHPREFFSGEPQRLLTCLDEKVQQLRSLGVQQLVLLPFDRELANLSPVEFVEKILVEQLQACKISVGQDFCFGRKRSGNSAELQAIAATFGIDVNIVPLHTYQGERISSSSIRLHLSQGEIERANSLLGRSYSLRGKVVEGQKLGRTLGFPTANLQLPPEKFLPRQGVYCVQVFLDKKQETSGGQEILPHPGVMNIGQRPTINGITTTIEVHLLDWSGDLYEQYLTVNLEKFLRPEEKFSSLEALKIQIKADATAAAEFFNAAR